MVSTNQMSFWDTATFSDGNQIIVRRCLICLKPLNRQNAVSCSGIVYLCNVCYKSLTSQEMIDMDKDIKEFMNENN